MKCVRFIFVFMLLAGLTPLAGLGKKGSNPLGHVEKWMIVLSYEPNEFPITRKELLNFQMAILDPDVHPSFRGIRERVILIGYVSVGEAEEYRDYWPKFKDSSALLGPNENWPGGHRVDPSSEEWHNIVLNEVLPHVVEEGFQGIMLDTLDTVDYFQDHKEKFQQAKEGMISLVHKIHEKYPSLYLISNNGFSILDEIAPDLTAMLSEDICMMIDWETGGYRRVPQQARAYKVHLLQKMMKKYNLPVFTIDYVDPKDVDAAKRCWAMSRRLGFRPYLAEAELDRLYKYEIEPSRRGREKKAAAQPAEEKKPRRTIYHWNKEARSRRESDEAERSETSETVSTASWGQRVRQSQVKVDDESDW